jgi:hypothetical protein
MTLSSLDRFILELQPLSTQGDDMFVVERVELSEPPEPSELASISELVSKSELSDDSAVSDVSLEGSVESTNNNANIASAAAENKRQGRPRANVGGKRGRPPGQHNPATCNACIKRFDTAQPRYVHRRMAQIAIRHPSIVRNCVDNKDGSSLGHFDFSFLAQRGTRGICQYQVNKESDSMSR